MTEEIQAQVVAAIEEFPFPVRFGKAQHPMPFVAANPSEAR
jgi:hypothetical protein